ncbi:MAG: hypothetical protein ACK5H1_05655, partial [Tenacibaculum sp.]
MYDGKCPKTYYFNVLKSSLSPEIVKQDIICGKDGKINVHGVPDGYHYSLSGPEGYFVDFQYSNIFTVTNPGDYNLKIRKADTNAATCTYNFDPINIQSRQIDFDIIPSPILCSGDKGKLRVQVNNVPGQFKYTLYREGTVIATEGPTNSNDHTFDKLNQGNYKVKVTTQECSLEKEAIITKVENLSVTAVATKNVSCTDGSSDGIITLSAQGGTIGNGLYYNFAVWSKDGNELYDSVSEIPAEAFFIEDSYAVPKGSEGAYIFVVIDSNNCVSFSNEISVEVESPLSFTAPVINDVRCNGESNGTISIAVNGSNQGYTIEYNIDNGSEVSEWNTTGIFKDLSVGTYTINIRASKPNYQCSYIVDNLEIKDKTLVASTASITQDYICDTLGQITFTEATGGTPPYSYGINDVYDTALVYDGFTAGDYNLTVQDNNGCIQAVDNLTIDPLPLIPISDFGTDTVYNCDGTANTTLTPPASSSLSYSYSLDGGANIQTSNIFSNLPVGSHTITVLAPRACPKNIFVTVEDL